MVLVNGSLMPVLGKEAAFITAQALVSGTEYGVEPIVYLSAGKSIFSGAPANMKSGLALTAVLLLGLLYEAKHAVHHFKETRAA